MKTNQNQIVKIIGMIILVSGCSPKVKTLDPTAATTASVSATPTPASTIFGDLMASMGFRTDNSSVDLTSQAAVDARIRALISDEASGTFVTKGNSLVPNPLFDSDGRYNADGDGAGATGVPEKRNYLETVKGGRPAKVCGLTGTIDERIANCALVANNGAKATYEGAKYGQNGEGDWKLVTLYKTAAAEGAACAGGKAAGCFEVWRDERTKLIWSDLHDNGGQNYNWFQAAGYSKNASTISQTYFEGGRPAETGLTYSLNCDSDWGSPPISTTTCQPTHPVSVCADATALNTAVVNGVNNYQNPDGTDPDGISLPDERPNKGNLTGATHQWRLPTMEDYKLADVNGIRKVLPNMDIAFWSASSSSINRNLAWVFGGGNGYVNGDYRYYNNGVRCVGR